jgi:RNA polymerase sigma-70 factor (ECF subfamily)
VVSGPSSHLRNELTRSIPNLRAFAMSLCGNSARADDLAQETLVKAWDKLALFGEGTNLKAWLFTILRNTFYSEQRKRKREVEDADGTLSARLAIYPEQHAHMDVSDFLVALQRLPSDQREALILVGAEGFAYEEVAAISGCAVGTVKSRVNRARRRMSDILGLDRAHDFGPDAMSQVVVNHGRMARSK